VSPAPSLKHQLVVTNLLRLLFPALHDTGLAIVLTAPFDVILANSMVAEPDVVIVSRTRREVLEERGAFGPPDLVIEVLSPSNTKHDRVTKRRMYARGGIREYWIADPDSGSLEVLTLIDSGLTYQQAGFYANREIVKSVVFDIAIPVEAIFADVIIPDDDLAD
jgi:Uma2 family endonuclease